METGDVKSYFEKDAVVEDYARAVVNVGLWESEKALFQKYFERGHALLELGCGAGRIAHGLDALGFSDILASDISENMAAKGAEIGACLGSRARFAVINAVDTGLESASFDGVIFGFNGLMQVPKAAARARAVAEAFRVLKPGGRFIFTTHDRAAKRNRDYWDFQGEVWAAGRQNPKLDEFGDNYYEGEHGRIFIHSPRRAEIEEALDAAGFVLEESAWRGEIALEPESVRAFSDECVFWIAKKP